MRTEIRLMGKNRPAFQVCGGTGFVLAVAVAMALTWRLGLSGWITLALAAAGAFTFLALAMAVKIVTGEERLIYYHHEVAVVAAAALLLRALRQPPAPYLDVTVLGIGVMLMCGRMGCLMVGCCHGRPCAWGVRYGERHAEAGFPRCYVGVPLFPVQLVEAVVLLGILLEGVFMIFHRPPGSAFAWYVSAYAVLRFLLEFLRGDPGRGTVLGFNQAQWTSLAFSAGAGIFFFWCRGASALLLTCMAAVVAVRRIRAVPRHRLLDPRHVWEVAEALARIGRRGLRVESTSLGIRISASAISGQGGPVEHVALSSRGAPLSREAADVLARLVLRLRYPEARTSELIAGNRGVFHLLVPVRREG